MRKLLYIDLFCGAGGTSTGVEAATLNGQKCASVIACVNHDANAIASHLANHPEARHYTEDIRTLDLTGLKEHTERQRTENPGALLVLWASLECTNFSRAKGGMPRDADSRTLAEHLFRYIDELRPDYIQIENVREFMMWGDLDENGKPVSRDAGRLYLRWVKNVCSRGYDFSHRILNAADFGAYTSRERFFGVFARKGLPIVFPEPTHCRKPEKGLFGQELKPWKPVRDVLDLDDEGQSIFDRKKPLVEATLRRIKAGLYKFVAGGDTSFLTKAFSGTPEDKCSPVSAPAGTLTTVDHHQFINTYYRHGECKPLTSPTPTIRTKDCVSLVSVIEEDKNILFMDNQYGKGYASPVESPCWSLTPTPKQKLIKVKHAEWHYIVNPQFGDAGASLDRPCPTVIARQDKKPLQLAGVHTHGPLPSFIKEQSDGTLLYEVFDDESQTLKDIKQFMCMHGIVDITMRMLRIRELKLIQGFPEDYVLVGTQSEQKKFIGNAVETHVACALCKCISETINS